ncbi:PEP-CTERM sorting domain-containing protein [Haloferula sp.]|uniref:PEP-CTERM sorting domain-containing protein n=1 Tax=Haloferula sp. TaxID=2497595 RepID=UPI0032A106DA
MKKTGFLALSLLAAGVANAAVYDIGDINTVTFDSSVDTLTNTGGITDWDNSTLNINDGSNMTGVDLAGLGVTSWTSSSNGGAVTNWTNANLSGIALNFSGGNNQFRDDNWNGANLSGATFTVGNNQPFVSTNNSSFQNTDFSGTTFDFTYTTAGAFGFNAFGGDVGSDKLAGADFSDSVWLFTGTSDGDADAFNIGPGSTSIATKAFAADFSGADFSGVTDADTMGEIVANLGLIDGTTNVGAIYDSNTVLPTGFTTADLDAAGWQTIPEPSSLLLGVAGMGLMLRRRVRN